MGNFRVGDKVICINDDWGGKNLIYPAVSDIYEITFPKQGRVYTVYSTKSIKNSPVISISELNFDIREVSRIQGRNFKGPWFMSYRFIKWYVMESDEKHSNINTEEIISDIDDDEIDELIFEEVLLHSIYKENMKS